MRHFVFAVIALMLAGVQYAWLSTWPWAPDLVLALAAWGMVDGVDKGVPVRAFLAGAIADVVDPGSESFHLVTFLALAALYLPIRSFMFRGRFAGWALWGFVAAMLVGLADRALAGSGETTLGTLLLQALLTALVAGGIGWLMRGLPEALRPVAKAGA